MFDNIIAYSVRNKFFIGLMVVALLVWGLYSLRQLPIDAVPDITNNQVQIITTSPSLATLEVEQFITAPIELSLQNLQRIEEIRSISRFGLSVVTVVFEESHDIYLARQLVNEQLSEARENIPDGLGKPYLAPISTGLGEIYQYVVRAEEGYENQYSLTELRTIQDWIVKRQLNGIEGVAEVNSMGGYLKQYEVALDPERLKAMGITMQQVFEAVAASNENTGGAYIEKTHFTYYIRSEGLARSLKDIENIVLDLDVPTPILIRDVAEVRFGKAPRYGALVRNGEEAVGGKVMMFKGANSAQVTERIQERVEQVKKSLPEGVVIEPYLVRDKLITTAIGTVRTNLIEGGLIVIFILVIMLGNWRAGLIVASVIPLAMLFAVGMMNQLGISANLMSLGAIDFGLIIDGAVIVVESIVHRLQSRFPGQKLSIDQMNKEVTKSAQRIRNSAAFGEIIILMVYLPILALVGIEGKMFRPMAQTVMLAIAGALVLSMTYVPMMAALFLKKDISDKTTIADRIMEFFQKMYAPLLSLALRFKLAFVGLAVLLLAISIFAFTRMGGEFIPTLEEGDLALQHILPPGSSLSQSVETARMIQNKLQNDYPEVTDAIVNIGSAEIPTDPMPVEIGDYAIIMKPKDEWTSASTRLAMFEKWENSLADIPGVAFEFTQPIQLRFNELMTGTKADVAIKLYGEDLDVIYQKAKEAENVIRDISGVATVNVEQTVGMPQVIVTYNYERMAQYGLRVRDVNRVVRTAFAGEQAGTIYEGEKRFDLVVRLSEGNRIGISDVENLYVALKNGSQIPLHAIADVALKDAPMQISRENTNRRIVIGVNVGNTDVQTLVDEIRGRLDAEVELPFGYYFTYGGQFENLKAANARLAIAVPAALALIFILLYFTFQSVSQAALIFTAIPLAAIGGVWALYIRGMPFSISAGIGFIALFGVAVLNGIVLISYFNQLKKDGMQDLQERIVHGTQVRLRPVLMTAAVASLGFLPMAISTSGGAEVQRPLATVVIGGLITATILTLIILPILYAWLERWQGRSRKRFVSGVGFFLLCITLQSEVSAQQTITMTEAVEIALTNHPTIENNKLDLDAQNARRNLPYQPGTTSLFYQGDGLFRANGQQVSQLGFQQVLPSGALNRAHNVVSDRRFELVQINGQIGQAEISWEVKKLYLEVQYQQARQRLYRQLINLHQTYLDKAQTRVGIGVTTDLEPLQLENKVSELKMLLKQSEVAVEYDLVRLSALLGGAEYIPVDTLAVLNQPSMDTTTSLWEERIRREVALRQAEVGVAEARLNPDFRVGYAIQNFNDGGWLHGLQAGVAIPLFNKQEKQEISALQIEAEKERSKGEVSELNIELQLDQASKLISIHQQGLEFYGTQIQTSQIEMERIASLNYEAGELPYLELLRVLEFQKSNARNYLEAVYKYNNAVIFYQFLTNQ